MNFIQSAIGVNFPDTLPTPSIELLDPAPNFTADAFTWIQPTALQDAAALKTLTNQPNLLTNPPALPTEGLFTLAEWATPLVPGELVDRIADAVCDEANPANDGANALRNPIDNSCITEDALGNPRVDGNNSRNIGAVQVNEAPHLAVVGVVSGGVDLSWTKPKDLVGDFTGYVLFYRESGSTGAFTEVPISGPDTLTYQVTGLTNGTEYEFLIDSFVDGAPSVFYPSNVVTATPLGTIGTPSLTVTSTSCGSALLEWTQPDLGGHPFGGYTVTWSLEGSDSLAGAILIPDYDTLSTTIDGLDCNARYNFAVGASSVDGASGGQGTGSVLIPPPAPVPTLDQLGLLLLTLLTLGLGLAGMRRYRRNPFDVG